MADLFENPWSKGNESSYLNPENLKEKTKWGINGKEQFNALFPNSVSKEKNIINYDSIYVKSRKDITIIIDPGHGNKTGNTGATFIKAYQHKVKDENGKPVIDADTKKEKVIETKIESLPDYVKKEVTKLPNSKSWTWAKKAIYDNTKLERNLVWDVSLELKNLLSSAGYNVLVTRNNKVLEAKGDRKDRQNRIDFANKNNAHYFISIHADGSINFEASGSHSIYRSGSEKGYTKRQKELAEDIFHFYNVTEKKNSPKQRDNLQVLSPTLNKSYRCSLIEIGFVTNADDWLQMDSNKTLIARQVAKGLEKNIVKFYYKYEEDVTKPIGYLFNNKVYQKKEDAFAQYNALIFANPFSTIQKPEIAFEFVPKRLSTIQY